MELPVPGLTLHRTPSHRVCICVPVRWSGRLRAQTLTWTHLSAIRAPFLLLLCPLSCYCPCHDLKSHPSNVIYFLALSLGLEVQSGRAVSGPQGLVKSPCSADERVQPARVVQGPFLTGSVVTVMPAVHTGARRSVHTLKPGQCTLAPWRSALCESGSLTHGKAPLRGAWAHAAC